MDEQLYEDESEAEDIFDSYELVKKKVKRQGPTTRSHSHAPLPVRTDWAPSDDEEQQWFLREEDDDEFEPVPFVLPNGRKSRAKKQTEKVWYDETRENPEQQFRLKLCFKDVYQFRQALCRLHIVQVRNFHYHINCPDMIIVWCEPEKKERYKCQFFISASQIKHEKTYCFNKHNTKPRERSHVLLQCRGKCICWEG